MEWLANILKNEVENTKLPLFIMGEDFKRDSNIKTGSSVLLLEEILTEKEVDFEINPKFLVKGIYFIGTNHTKYENLQFPKNSIVIDPWGVIQYQNGVLIKRIGRS
jgi:hypothetical protein